MPKQYTQEAEENGPVMLVHDDDDEESEMDIIDD